MSNQDRKFRWGIVGTGKIAVDFASQLSTIDNASLHAVLSRSTEKAELFRTGLGAERAYDTLEEMLQDSALDAVYIAVPAGQHRDYCIQALRARIPVLCEKPFAPDAGQAEEILAVAREEGVFCMEAMWMRFSPVIRRVLAKSVSGELGQIRSINVQAGNITPLSRLADGDPGRGALLNFGVYGVSLSQMLLGDPQDIDTEFIALDNGLDEFCTLTLRYPDALVSVTASVRLPMSNEAVITGTRGRVRIGSPFFSPGWAELSRFTEPASQQPVSVTPVISRQKIDRIPFLGLAQGAFWTTLLRRRGQLLMRRPGDNGLRLEAQELMRCVNNGAIESDIMPHRDTLSVARILDKARSG